MHSAHQCDNNKAQMKHLQLFNGLCFAQDVINNALIEIMLCKKQMEISYSVVLCKCGPGVLLLIISKGTVYAQSSVGGCMF